MKPEPWSLDKLLKTFFSVRAKTITTHSMFYIFASIVQALSHLTLSKMLEGKYCYYHPCCIDKETEAGKIKLLVGDI